MRVRAHVDANGTLVSIWRKRFKGGPMDPMMLAELEAGRGLRGNANQGGRRQVTILAEEAWREANAQLGADVDPAARRANLLIRGIDLERSNGRILRVGPCRIRIYGETRPCEQMDDAQEGLRDALRPHWRAGAFGEILDNGVIAIGDAVCWE